MTRTIPHGLKTCWEPQFLNAGVGHKQPRQKSSPLSAWMRTFWSTSRLKGLATSHGLMQRFARQWSEIQLAVRKRQRVNALRLDFDAGSYAKLDLQICGVSRIFSTCINLYEIFDKASRHAPSERILMTTLHCTDISIPQALRYTLS